MSEKKNKCPNCNKLGKYVGLCLGCSQKFCEKCIGKHYEKQGLVNKPIDKDFGGPK
jgi:uncharacterized UBP type Zn finger protein